jgi:hypothetical protein
VKTRIGLIGEPPWIDTIRNLIADADFDVLCAGRYTGGEILGVTTAVPDDGCPREVAQRADVLLTRFDTAEALDKSAKGADGFLASAILPPVIEMSSISLRYKLNLRRHFINRRSAFIDAPISGNAEMIAGRRAAMYVSGDCDFHHQHQRLLRAVSAHTPYVGTFGEGTRTNFVAQLVCALEATDAMDDMPWPRLDLYSLTTRSGICPFAMSEKFQARTAEIAAEEFAANVSEVGLRTAVAKVIGYGKEIPAPHEVMAILASGYRRLSAA